MRQMGQKEIPFTLIFTKSDKLKPGELERNIERYTQTLMEEWDEMPLYFISSATHKIGKEAILDYIEELNRGWKLPPREIKKTEN